jgi:hypothetical protein
MPQLQPEHLPSLGKTGPVEHRLSYLPKDRVYKMTQVLYLNVLDPQFTRYIELRHELEDYLIEIYGAGIDFQVSVSKPCWCWVCKRLNQLKHECDRWSFYGPDDLNEVSLFSAKDACFC